MSSDLLVEMSSLPFDELEIKRVLLATWSEKTQPAFFKDLCAKYQFPSGINKIQPKVQEHINNHLQIRQFAFVLKTLDILRTKNIFLTKKQIGYYLLNSYDVLSAKANIEEVINVIESDTVQGIKREIVNPEKASSYTYQHITEQLNLLLLANCIIYNNEFVILNEKELPFIQELAKNYNTLPVFNFYKYDLSVPEERKKADYDWNKYFSELSDLNKEFLITETTALNTQEVKTEPHDMYYRFDKIALGDEGEEFVYQLEKKRIENLFPRLVNKIKKLGKIKGIGYDIQSVIGNGKNPEFVKYIEVKSTKRVTAPTHEFRDSINLTRNEWTAAQQHNQYFYIYRVYFCQNETKIFIIHNPYNLNENNTIYTIPLNYRMDFSQNAGEFL